MKKLILSVLLIPAVFSAQQTVSRDAEIANYVSQVSADSLKSHINKLVSFGTRHTMSSTTDAKKGIGAARNWVLSKFKNYAKNADGRMEVFLQNQTIQPDGKRINQPTDLGNAIAILRGTDPNDKRIFMIGGHLDSRVSDVMNAKDFAPGANDDGSGVGAVIESARILSQSKFPATIVFVAFSGEEQGLLGAKMLAEKAKNENWQLEALLNNDMIGNNLTSETNLINANQLRVFSEGLPQFDLDKKAQGIRNLGLENDGEARQLARYIKEIGERYDNYALPWDQVSTSGFAPLNTLNMSNLVNNSAKRLTQNKNYQLLLESAQWKEKLDKEEKVTLNLKEFESLMKARKEQIEKFKSLIKFNNGLNFTLHADEAKRGKTDEVFAKKSENWLKNLKRDIYLQETVNIISEMK